MRILFHWARNPAGLIQGLLIFLLSGSLISCAGIPIIFNDQPLPQKAIASPQLITQFENAIANRLIDTIPLNPWLDRQASIQYLEQLRDTNRELEKLNGSLLDDKNRQAIKRLHRLAAYWEEKVSTWDTWNHLQTLGQFLPAPGYEKSTTAALEKRFAEIDWSGTNIKVLIQVLKDQHQTGYRYPEPLIAASEVYLDRLLSTRQNPFEDRIQLLLSYTDLSAAEQKARANELSNKYRANLVPVLESLAQTLAGLRSVSTAINKGTLATTAPGLSQTRFTEIEQALAIQATDLAILEQQIGSSAKAIYRSAEYRIPDHTQSQTLLDLFSLHLEEYKSLEQLWQREPEDQLTIALDDNLLFTPTFRDNQLLLIAPSALLELPAFEWQTRAYLAAAIKPGAASLSARARDRGIGLFMIDLLDEQGLYTDQMTRYGLLQQQRFENLLLVAERKYSQKIWNIEQVADYLSAESPYSESFIQNSIVWLLADPGLIVSSHKVHQQLRQQWQMRNLEQGIALSFQSRLRQFMQTVILPEL